MEDVSRSTVHIAVLLSLLLVCGCGYSVKSLLPPHLRTVAIPPVKNSTMQPGLDAQLDDLLPAAFNRDRSLRATTLDDASLVVSVTLAGYSRAAAAYDESQTILTYDLSVSAQVEAEDRIRDETFFSGTVAERVDYNPEAETEEAAAARLLERLASEIVRRIITTW